MHSGGMTLCTKTKLPVKKAEVKIIYYFATKHRRDPDNYSGKFILDGLVNAGILEDDSFGNVELVLRGRVDRKNPRTEIEIGGVLECVLKKLVFSLLDKEVLMRT